MRSAASNRVTKGQHIVAVRGATGFVGTATVSSLVEAGRTVLAFTRRVSETERLRRAGAEPVVMRGDHAPSPPAPTSPSRELSTSSSETVDESATAHRVEAWARRRRPAQPWQP